MAQHWHAPQYKSIRMSLYLCPSIYHCPAYNGLVTWEGSGVLGILGSYGYNIDGAAPAEDLSGGLGLGSDFLPHARREAEVIAPAEMFAIMDSQTLIPYSLVVQAVSGYGGNISGCTVMGTGWSGNAWADCAAAFANQVSSSKGVFWPTQHGQAHNVLFCDGHVAPVKVTDLMNPAKTALNWNYDHQPHREYWDEVLEQE
jgi:prepilin-type processing-associated H-X9-DG protein